MNTDLNLPEGYQSITPYFSVADADRFIGFVQAAFDAEIVKEDRAANSRIQHARLCIGTSIIMLNEANDAYAANVSQMHLYVVDADAAYRQAVAAGAASIMEPNNRPHGDRMAGVRDPSGNIWWLATHKG